MKKQISISEINIILVKPRDGLIGFASFILNGDFYMGSIAIFSKLDGNIRLLFPRKNNVDCFYPIRKEIGEYLERTIQKKLNNILTNNNNGNINTWREPPANSS